MENLHKSLATQDDDEEQEIPQIKLQGYVYAWGKNKDGELSVGHTKNCTLPTPVKGIKDKVIAYLNSGGQHTGVVTQDGQILVSGSALHGKLGFCE